MALLELDALLSHVIRLCGAGDRHRYDTDIDYRWAVHRVWIAIGNEALAYADAAGLNCRRDQPWARLYLQRNMLAHQRLPDIDDDAVWRDSVLRTSHYRAAVRANLR